MDHRGLDAVLYRGAANTTPSLLMTNVRKVKLNREWAEANTTRRADGIAYSKPTILTATIEFEMITNSTDADYLAIMEAARDATALAFKCLDSASGEGVMGDFYVFTANRDEDEEKEEVLSVTLKPTRDYRVLTKVATS